MKNDRIKQTKPPEIRRLFNYKQKKEEFMKTALCQLEIEFENREANIVKAEKYITEASESGADIVFFPEMTLTGFSMNVNKTGEDNNDTAELMSSFASKHNIAVGFGWVKNAGDKGENHYSVVSPEGKMLADYIKIHPFSYSKEDRYYNAGESLVSFEYCGKPRPAFVRWLARVYLSFGVFLSTLKLILGSIILLL